MRHQLQILSGKFKYILHPGQFPVAEDGGNHLGDDRSDGNAGNAQAQLGYEQQIQRHIQRCRDQQKYQRRQRVTQAPENTREHIVKEEAHNAQEHNIEVTCAPLYDGIRCAQQLQKRSCDQGTQDHNHHTGDGSQGQAVAHR